MSSTPLLSGGLSGAMQDHPAFLRACHSPWKLIPQNVLAALRGCLVAYILGTTAMITHYKMNVEESEAPQLRHAFNFSLISHILMAMFQVIAWAWTFTHLYYPDASEVRGGVESLLVRFMSLPRNMGSLRKQFYFTLFHTVATVFPLMNSVIYWFVTRPHEAAGGDALALAAAAATGKAAGSALVAMPDKPFSDLFGEGWFKPYILFNLHGINSLIMVFETLFLNSMKSPVNIGMHLVGVMACSGLYLGWAAIGKRLTGEFPFFWLDEAEVGSKEAVTLYCMGFALLSQLMYTLMQGFVGMRDGMLRSLQGGGGDGEQRDGLNS